MILTVISGVTTVGVTRGGNYNGITLIFLEKADDRCLEVMTFLSVDCRLLATPIFPRRLSSALYKFSHKRNNFVRTL